jgi:hypothetical protein
MSSKGMSSRVLYGIGAVIGILVLVLSFIGLGSSYDTEPILGIGLIVLALAGITQPETK